MTFENVPEEHIYFHTTFHAQNPGRFLSCLRKEMALLMFSLPAGIIVRGYENRVVSVLLSVLKRGETDRERERESRKNEKISMHLFDAGTYSRHENSEWVIKLDDF